MLNPDNMIFRQKVMDVYDSWYFDAPSEKTLKVAMAFNMGRIHGTRKICDRVSENHFAELNDEGLLGQKKIDMLNEAIKDVLDEMCENLAEIDKEWQLRFRGVSKPRKPRKNGYYLLEKEVNNILKIAKPNNIDTLDEDVMMVTMAYWCGRLSRCSSCAKQREA